MGFPRHASPMWPACGSAMPTCWSRSGSAGGDEAALAHIRLSVRLAAAAEAEAQGRGVCVVERVVRSSSFAPTKSSSRWVRRVESTGLIKPDLFWVISPGSADSGSDRR